jgi:hypothetical protein
MNKQEAGGKPGDHHRFKFRPAGDPVELIEQVIAKRQGARLAISIEEIARELWPYEWSWCVAERNGFPAYPHRAQLQRAIKGAVRELRRQGRKIGSCRGSKVAPAGYYMITTSAELALTVAPLLRQAVDELRTVEALTGRNYYTAELAGQQRLFTAEKGTGDR